MSGGHFDYAYSRINDLADSIEKEIDQNQIPDEWGYAEGLSDETIIRMREIVDLLEMASKLAYAAEWLYSGDDGEETFTKKYEQISHEHDWIHVGDYDEFKK